MINNLNTNSSLNSATNVPSICPICNIFCGWQPYHLHVLIILKSGSFNLLKRSGPVQPCTGITFLSHILYWHITYAQFLTIWTSKMAVSWENLLCVSHCQERVLFVIIFSNPYYVKTFCEPFGSYCFCFLSHRTYENFIIARSRKNTMFLLRGKICDLCLVRIRTVTQILLIELFHGFSLPPRRRLGL